MRRTNAISATVTQGLTLALTVMLTVILPAGGCGGRTEIIDGVSDSAFAATMVELRRLDGAGAAVTGDGSAPASARAAVLQRRGLTPTQLERAAAALAEDPKRAQELFAAIDSGVTLAAGLPPPPVAPSTGRGAAAVPPAATSAPPR